MNGQVVSVAEERSPHVNETVAVHAMWDADDGVGWLTVYESDRAEVLRLAEKVELVSEREWDAVTAAVRGSKDETK